MNKMASDNGSPARPPAPAHDPPPRVERLLVVEPEALVRWSLTTYLGRWFTVFAVESQRAADQILDDEAIDALVVSDDLQGRTSQAVVSHARARNPRVVVVRTMSGPDDATTTPTDNAICLEKPFDLSILATHFGADCRSARPKAT